MRRTAVRAAADAERRPPRMRRFPRRASRHEDHGPHRRHHDALRGRDRQRGQRRPAPGRRRLRGDPPGGGPRAGAGLRAPPALSDGRGADHAGIPAAGALRHPRRGPRVAGGRGERIRPPGGGVPLLARGRRARGDRQHRLPRPQRRDLRLPAPIGDEGRRGHRAAGARAGRHGPGRRVCLLVAGGPRGVRCRGGPGVRGDGGSARSGQTVRADGTGTPLVPAGAGKDPR